MRELRQVDIPDGHGKMIAIEHDDGKVTIERYASRGHIVNRVETYEHVRGNKVELRALSVPVALSILERVQTRATTYSAAFMFEETAPSTQISMEKTPMEHRYTSTGIKFWRHQEQMESYRSGTGKTVISTHVSPEGACNLKCPYCSVTYRDTHSRIELDTVKRYVSNLQSRGLRAVILTGGGEPTIYPHFNALIRWIKEQGLMVALITNGTMTNKVDADVWKSFSWVRVSLNVFNGWEEKISLPEVSDDCVVGCSMVYTGEHEASKDGSMDRLELLRRAAKVATKVRARYVRLLPNCLLPQRELLIQHQSLDQTLRELDDPRFFHQHKVHGAPSSHVCHQAYFRPYLSEEKFHKDNRPGTVYPCDSVVLNEAFQHFATKYQLCHADDVLKFLDGEIEQTFKPHVDCKGCVFTDNVNLLQRWKDEGEGHFSDTPLTHEEFV